ncbi:uncharacterized protein [Dysidea avara]|uniref:uncharacterized protein n=1 Tax=Dysidea avara TaxID=196820 RepID=UPI00332852D0
MNFVRFGWQLYTRNVPRSVRLGGRQLCRNSSSNAKPSVLQDWRTLPLYLSIPVVGYYGVRYWVGGNGHQSNEKNVITLLLDYMVGDILKKSDEIMEEHLSRMEIKHKRHLQDMRVQKSGDLYIRRPMRVGGGGIAKNQARDVIDSGIDY